MDAGWETQTKSTMWDLMDMGKKVCLLGKVWQEISKCLIIVTKLENTYMQKEIRK